MRKQILVAIAVGGHVLRSAPLRYRTGLGQRYEHGRPAVGDALGNQSAGLSGLTRSSRRPQEQPLDTPNANTGARAMIGFRRRGGSGEVKPRAAAWLVSDAARKLDVDEDEDELAYEPDE
jgi:hypothetical protein